MSNFSRMAIHPETGKAELAEWLDDYFGSHIYGVRFADESVWYDHEVTTVDSIKDKFDLPIAEELP